MIYSALLRLCNIRYFPKSKFMSHILIQFRYFNFRFLYRGCKKSKSIVIIDAKRSFRAMSYNVPLGVGEIYADVLKEGSEPLVQP